MRPLIAGLSSLSVGECVTQALYMETCSHSRDCGEHFCMALDDNASLPDRTTMIRQLANLYGHDGEKRVKVTYCHLALFAHFSQLQLGLAGVYKFDCSHSWRGSS